MPFTSLFFITKVVFMGVPQGYDIVSAWNNISCVCAVTGSARVETLGDRRTASSKSRHSLLFSTKTSEAEQ